MPELPEVETVKETLRKNILGLKIAGIDVYYAKIIHNSSVEDFKKRIIGNKIEEIYRKGKYLYFKLNDDLYLISHLRMEGKYYLKDKSLPIEKHEHIVFHLANGIDLRYHDVRKFGVMELKNQKDLFKTHPLSDLGPDAYQLTKEYLYENLRRNKPIKTLLLDQEIIAGIGNIYADEILFKSKLNPEEPGINLTMDDCNNISINAKEIMLKAIKAGGTTIRSYTSSLGVTGLFQLELNVHTKVNEPCPLCGTTILKTRVGGRGTYYCPNCQRLRK